MDYSLQNLLATRKTALAATTNLIANRGSIDPEIVDKCIKANLDVIDLNWIDRHAKLIYQIGPSEYCTLADQARKGRKPIALMAHLVNSALSK